MMNFSQEGLWRVTALLVRRSDIEGQAFTDRLSGELAPAIARALGGGQDVHVVADRRPPTLDPALADMFPPLFDGMLGLWFASGEAAAAGMRSLHADEKAAAIAAPLIDPERSIVWLAEVFPVKPERGETRTKFLAGGDAAEGMSVEDAQRYWRDRHPEVAKTVPSAWNMLTRYVQFHGRAVPGLAGTSWLGRWRLVPMAAEMGFADARDFITHYNDENYLAVIRPDEERFSRPGEMLAFVSGEEREIGIG